MAVAIVFAAAPGCTRRGVVLGDAGGVPDSAVHGCTAPTLCDGTTVRACRDGLPADVLAECAPDRACSRGRCTSRACANAELDAVSFVGCLFYTLNVDNVTSDDGNTTRTSLLVTNPGATVARVELQVSGVDRLWSRAAVGEVEPHRAARLIVPGPHFEGGGYGARAALRLSSDTPVTAAHVQSDDGTESAGSTGGTLLLPVHVLGRRYMAVTYPQRDGPKLMATAGSRGGAGQVIIVGTEDDTHVTFQVSATASLGLEGGAPARDPGGSFDLVLEDGDVYQIFSSAEGDDLTGSEITADRPVAVFSGNISTTYGRVSPGINSPDMAHEQLLPDTAWGVSFVAAALPPQQSTCDSLFGVPDASLWRIVAGQDGTMLTFDAPPGVSGLPPASAPLGRGQVLEMVVAGGSFTVTATRPVQMMQGMDCEPTLSSAVSTVRLNNDLFFAALPHFDQMIAIVRHPGRPTFLDGKRLDDLSFQPAGGGFEVGRFTLAACPSAGSVCAHHLSGEFGMTMRGMDVVCSYALTVPTWINCVDPTTPGCVL